MSNNDQFDNCDIAVIGGGPSGCIAALALAQAGYTCALISPEKSEVDGRTTALWQPSINLLKELGVWEVLEDAATPLMKMRMIDGTKNLLRSREVVFDSAELDIKSFGYNILNKDINSALEEKILSHDKILFYKETAVDFSLGKNGASLGTSVGRTIAVKLVVAADGRQSPIREQVQIKTKRWSYPQVAVVLNLEHRLPHQFISTEFHTETGPFTLVPLAGRSSALVCVETAEGAKKLLALSDNELEKELESRCHSILGSFKIRSKPQSFPLSGLNAEKMIAERVALIGESAHVFPPIGAQGLNLSIRDVLDLRDTLSLGASHAIDPGAPDVLRAYELKRLGDVRSRTAAVDLLNRSLLTTFLPIQALRSLGMYLTDQVSPLRKLLMRSGLGERNPRKLV